MLIIRKEQMEALEQAVLEGFEDRMVVHLQGFFPGRCAELGDDGMREMVRYGMERAKSYGIVNELDVCRYIDLMIFFGRDFDTDPETPWAGRILSMESLTDPTAKIDRLYEEEMKKLGKP